MDLFDIWLRDEIDHCDDFIELLPADRTSELVAYKKALLNAKNMYEKIKETK